MEHLGMENIESTMDGEHDVLWDEEHGVPRSGGYGLLRNEEHGVP